MGMLKLFLGMLTIHCTPLDTALVVIIDTIYELWVTLKPVSDGDEILFPVPTASTNGFNQQQNPSQNQNQIQSQHRPQFSSQSQYQYQPQFGSQSNAQQNTPFYNASNNLPMGASHFGGRIFITVPRRRMGVPSTLNFVYTKSTAASSPVLQAFPSQDINALHVNQKQSMFDELRLMTHILYSQIYKLMQTE